MHSEEAKGHIRRAKEKRKEKEKEKKKESKPQVFQSKDPHRRVEFKA